MRLGAKRIVGSLAIAVVLAGCYASHERPVDASVRDATLDAPRDAGSDAADAGDATTTCPSCGPRRVVGQQRFLRASGDFPWALLGIASSGEALGVLVAVDADDHAGDRYVEYKLLLVRADGTMSWAEPARTLRSRDQMLAGALDLRDGGFRAVVLGTDYTGPVAVRSASWSPDGSVLVEQNLGELPAPAVAYRSTRTGAVLLGASLGIATVADGAVLWVADLDLSAGRFAGLRAETLPATMATGATSVDGAMVGDRVAMALGGSWPTLVARGAALAAGPTAGPWPARPLAGSDTDPAPMVAAMASGFRLARFINDLDDSSRSAIHLWQLNADGTPAGETSIATGGLQPIAMVMSSERPSSSLLWVEHDPGDLRAGTLRLRRFDPSSAGATCTVETTLAHLPNSVIDRDPRSIVALRRDDAIVTAFLESDRESDRVTILEFPDCMW